MSDQKRPLAIVTATSQQGAPAACLAMSINEHNSTRAYDIIVLQQELNDSDEKTLRAIPRVQVRRYDFPSGFPDHMLKTASPTSKIRNKSSLMPFCHFESFKMLEFYRRVIWLDSDIIVQKSLDQLFDVAMLTATKDTPWLVRDNFVANVEGYDMRREGLCSAVLGLSDRLPYQDIYNWCFNEAIRLSHVLYNRDQGIINLALQHFDIKTCWLKNTKWQCMPWRREAQKAHIVHFGGNQKPWEDPAVLEKWPEWQKYYGRWTELGGAPYQTSPAIGISATHFITESNREKYLSLESRRIDDKLKAIQHHALKEVENTAIKLQRAEQFNGKDFWSKSDCGWLMPRNRRIHAMNQVFQRGAGKIPDILCSLNPSKPQVAAVFGGGLGDALKFSNILPHLVERLECEVTVVCDQYAICELKKYNPYITRYIVSPDNPYDLAEKMLHHTEIFDVIVIWRYTVRYLAHENSRVPEEILTRLRSHSERYNEPFDRYNHSNEVWSGLNNAFAREMARQNKGVLQTALASSGLGSSGGDEFMIPLLLPVPEDDSLSAFLSSPYITIHHGFDVKKLPSRTRETDYNSTKNLTTQKWIAIVNSLKAYGLKIVQLGSANEEAILGVDHNLTGSTTLAQTAMLLKNALCHLDTEGGLVHLNRAVHGTSVVMFGPTPISTFGYPQNVNLAPSACKECFWTTETWVLECPRETSGPECMAVYQPERVAATVAATVASKSKTGIELVESSTDLTLQNLPALLSQISTRLENLNSLGMAICSESNLEKVKEALGQCAGKFELYATDVQDPTLLAKTHTGVRVGSFVNMNTESDQYDAVLCVTDSWADIGGAFIMSEMLRVLKPEGLLIGITPDPSKRVAGLKSLFKDYRVEAQCPHDGELVRSFVFRKRYVQRCPIALPALKHLPYKNEYPSAPTAFSKRVEELHSNANVRLDKIHDQYNIWTEKASKAWEVSDKFIRSSLSPEGWISVSSQVVESYGSKFLLQGWYEPEDWGAWGRGFEHSLILPLDSFDGARECFIFEAELNVRLSPELPKRKISVVLNKKIDLEVCAEHEQLGVGDPLLLKFSVCTQDCLMNRFMLLHFKVDSLFIPNDTNPESKDNRAIGLGLVRFRYKFATARMTADSINLVGAPSSRANKRNSTYTSFLSRGKEYFSRGLNNIK
jgi:ADP-heptose:LPS heptosyltransferase/lipopolysaccharide biosynthesis glycosyltransferase